MEGLVDFRNHYPARGRKPSEMANLYNQTRMPFATITPQGDGNSSLHRRSLSSSTRILSQPLPRKGTETLIASLLIADEYIVTFATITPQGDGNLPLPLVSSSS